MHVQVVKSFTKGFLKFGSNTEFRSVAVYTFSNFFSKGLSFLLLFYFARVLSESDFGMFNLFTNGILFLMPFISLGILQSAGTEFFKKDKKEFGIFFSSTLLLPGIMTILMVCLFFIFRSQLQQWYSFPVAFVVLIPVITLFNFLNEHVVNMIRNNSEPAKYFFVNTGRLLLEIALAVFLISTLNMGWAGRVAGIFISYFAIAVYAFWYFKQHSYITTSFNTQYIKEELIYSVPIIVMQLSIFCMGSSGGYFIKHFTNDYAAVGVFSVAAAFGSVIPVLGSALSQYAYPKMYGMLSQQKVDYAGIKKLLIYCIGVMVLFTITVIIAVPVVYKVALKPSYAPGGSYCFFICAGYFFWSVTNFLNAFMLYHKQKKRILLSSLLSVIISVGLHCVFTRELGGYGAAIAVCITYFIVLLVTIMIMYKQLLPVFKSTVA